MTLKGIDNLKGNMYNFNCEVIDMKLNKRYILKEDMKHKLLDGRTYTCLAKTLNTSPAHIANIFNSRKGCSITTALALIYLNKNYSHSDEEVKMYFNEIK